MADLNGGADCGRTAATGAPGYIMLLLLLINSDTPIQHPFLLDDQFVSCPSDQNGSALNYSDLQIGW